MTTDPFSDKTTKRLKEVFPEWMDPFNPVDLYPAMEKNGRQKALLHALEAVMADPNVDAVYAHLIVLPIKEKLIDYGKVSELLKKYRKPIVVWAIGFSEMEHKIAQGLEAIGVPVVNEIDKGVRILAALTMGR